MTQQFSRFSMGAIALLLLCACKDDEKANAEPATVNEQLAAQNAQSTITTVATLMEQNDGQAAAQSMMSLGLASQSLLIPEAGTEPAKVRPSDVRLALESSASGLVGACECDEAARSCTFEDCGDEAGTMSINGTLSWSDNTLACDLEISGSMDQMGTSMTFDISIEADLAVTETSVDGDIDTTLTTEVVVENTTVTADVSSSVTFNEVTWDAATYQPTGGSMEVTASMSGNANGENVAYEGSGSISFP